MLDMLAYRAVSWIRRSRSRSRSRPRFQRQSLTRSDPDTSLHPACIQQTSCKLQASIPELSRVTVRECGKISSRGGRRSRLSLPPERQGSLALPVLSARRSCRACKKILKACSGRLAEHVPGKLTCCSSCVETGWQIPTGSERGYRCFLHQLSHWQSCAWSEGLRSCSAISSLLELCCRFQQGLRNLSQHQQPGQRNLERIYGKADPFAALIPGNSAAEQVLTSGFSSTL